MHRDNLTFDYMYRVYMKVETSNEPVEYMVAAFLLHHDAENWVNKENEKDPGTHYYIVDPERS